MLGWDSLVLSCVGFRLGLVGMGRHSQIVYALAVDGFRIK